MNMACVKFSITSDGKFPVSGWTTLENARTLAAFLVETGDIGNIKTDPDNFSEMKALTPGIPAIAHRCFALPPVLNEKSVWVDDCAGADFTYVCYSATQEALYFYPESTPFEVAVTMASVAVACGNVETVHISQTKERWEFTTPEGIPASVLTEAYGEQFAASPAIRRKEAAV